MDKTYQQHPKGCCIVFLLAEAAWLILLGALVWKLIQWAVTQYNQI